MLERVYSILEIIDTELLHGWPYLSAIVLILCFTFPAPLRTLEAGKTRGQSKWVCRSSALVQFVVLMSAAAIFLRWSDMGHWGADLHERADHHYILILSVCVISLAMRFGLAGVLLTGFVKYCIRWFPEKSASLVDLAGSFTSDRPGLLRFFRPPAFLFSPRLGHVLDVSLMKAMNRAFRAQNCLISVPIYFEARLSLSRIARLREPEVAFYWDRQGEKARAHVLVNENKIGAPRGGELFSPQSGSDADAAIDRECRWLSSALLACDRCGDRSERFSQYAVIFTIWMEHIEAISEPENRFQEKLEIYDREVIENHLQLVRCIVESETASESFDIETWYFVLRDTFLKSDPKPDPIVRLSAVLFALHLFDQRLLTWCHSILEIYLVVDRVDDKEPSDPLRELAAWIYFRCMEDMLQALNPDVELTDLSTQPDENNAGQFADYPTRLKSMWQLAEADLPLLNVVSKGAK